ncbi:unnamed protein product [Prunus armeniaca]
MHSSLAVSRKEKLGVWASCLSLELALPKVLLGLGLWPKLKLGQPKLMQVSIIGVVSALASFGFVLCLQSFCITLAVRQGELGLGEAAGPWVFGKKWICQILANLRRGTRILEFGLDNCLIGSKRCVLWFVLDRQQGSWELGLGLFVAPCSRLNQVFSRAWVCQGLELSQQGLGKVRIFVAPYKGFGREESEKEKRDFRQDFGGGACGQGDFQRHSVVVQTRCLKVLIKKVLTPSAFGTDDTESEYVCSEYESSQTKGLVEGLVEARMAVHESERTMPRSPEVGSSNQASPSGSKVGWLQTTVASLGADDVGQVGLGGWLGWGSRHLSSLCISTRSPRNREVLAVYKPIAERQRRGVTSLVTSLLLRSLGETGGAWLMVIGSGRQGRSSPDTFQPTSSL